MKIENIIEDIIQDTIDIKDKLEVQIKKENPQLNFTINLPEIEKLSAIKLVELSVNEDNNTTHTFRAEIHTHNGHRVFENASRQAMRNHDGYGPSRHPLQDWFIDILREVIKRKKIQLKSYNKSANRYNDAGHYANPAC